MCDVDHREITSRALSELVSSGGGVKTTKCQICNTQYIVSYAGPSGLFSDVRMVTRSS